MKIKTLLLGSILSIFSVSVLAGGGHDHGHGHSHSQTLIKQDVAKLKATEYVAALAKRNKLDKSWVVVKASSAEKKMFNGKQEWVVVFENKEITDKAKQKLYVFLTLGGDYVAANYTGN